MKKCTKQDLTPTSYSLMKLSKACILFAFLLLPMLAGCEETSLPEGWRFPTNADFIGEWEENEEFIEKPYLVEADFDGNGVMDQAWILIKNDNSWGVFVTLDLDSIRIGVRSCFAHFGCKSFMK